MRRRDFIKVVAGSASIWPLAARGQQALIGLLSPGSADSEAFREIDLKRGLSEAGYVEGQNLRIEYRRAEGKYDQLPALAADLVHHQVAAIVTIANVSSIAAKAATATIPIVFTTGADPVELGLVASLNQPGGNATGVTFFTIELEPKKLELLRELLPGANVISLLVNPSGPNAKSTIRDVLNAAKVVGQRIEIVNASAESEFDTAIASAVRLGADAVFVGADPLFTDARGQLVAIVAHYRIPAIYSFREFAAAGGLISYGISFAEVYRQAGSYTGRILKGTKPADLPVFRTTKFELVINLKTAKALGLTVLPALTARADEVIE